MCYPVLHRAPRSLHKTKAATQQVRGKDTYKIRPTEARHVWLSNSVEIVGPHHRDEQDLKGTIEVQQLTRTWHHGKLMHLAYALCMIFIACWCRWYVFVFLRSFEAPWRGDFSLRFVKDPQELPESLQDLSQDAFLGFTTLISVFKNSISTSIWRACRF